MYCNQQSGTLTGRVPTVVQNPNFKVPTYVFFVDLHFFLYVDMHYFILFCFLSTRVAFSNRIILTLGTFLNALLRE